MFRRWSTLPSLETITRNGQRLRPRFTRLSCISVGSPSRTLSRFKLVWPINTASAKARCRNKCNLSSREVKSTGDKFFVVTLPSTVIAKVATTTGRWRLRFMTEKAPNSQRPMYNIQLSELGVRSSGVEGCEASSFRFANLMFQRDYFVFHLANFHTCDCATRLVKQINDRAWQTADENDEETERADENGFCFRHSAKAAKHDL